MSILTQTVDELVESLVEQTFEQLCMLSDCKEVVVHGFSVAIWKDRIALNEVRVVVQGYQGGQLGVGMMYARGFRKTTTNTIIELSESELQEFS